MGLRIFKNEAGVQHLELTCDDEGPQTGKPTTQALFSHEGGFTAQHKEAKGAGWLQRYAGRRGFVWLCPECAKKPIKEK